MSGEGTLTSARKYTWWVENPPSVKRATDGRQTNGGVSSDGFFFNLPAAASLVGERCLSTIKVETFVVRTGDQKVGAGTFRSRFRITTNVDQGFSTIQNFQPKKLTNQKTAGTKSLSLSLHVRGGHTYFCPEVHLVGREPTKCQACYGRPADKRRGEQ